MDIKKKLNYYLNLNWTYTLEQQNNGKNKLYILKVNELPGVCTDAKTLEEAMADIQDSIAATIELYLEQGDPIPEPISREKYKGNIAYRTTSERHYHLAKVAQQRHISMNKALDLIFDEGVRKISQ